MTIAPSPDSSKPITEMGIAWQEFANKYYKPIFNEEAFEDGLKSQE